jgi:hypothetical protein
MTLQDGGGKLPGKTKYAGRRRAMTRSSGFSVHKDTSGGEFRRYTSETFLLRKGETLEVTFSIAGHKKGQLLGYGVWFWRPDDVHLTVSGGPDERTNTSYADAAWNKLGSIWRAQNAAPISVTAVFTANRASEIALYKPICGQIRHKHLDGARPELLKNMYQFAPEAVFVDEKVAGDVEVTAPNRQKKGERDLILKSCNRCGRYLPINVPHERHQLSFSNHCVAAHRRPCRHATFGRLRNAEHAEDLLRLDYGYQLECRFCKKFEVNAAHNPQRTSAQMKEDAARRRAFELLLAELYQGTPQLRYRHQYGSELADDIWDRFEGRCFNCGTPLGSTGHMHLDHTRPLALLWPLDISATALCGSCNSAKRDRAPADFYTKEQLVRLSAITKVSVEDLSSPHPNDDAISLLLKRLDWFFDTFLTKEEMTKERDGKIAGELVVKALQKVFARSPRYHEVDLVTMYDKRRAKRR